MGVVSSLRSKQRPCIKEIKSRHTYWKICQPFPQFANILDHSWSSVFFFFFFSFEFEQIRSGANLLIMVVRCVCPLRKYSYFFFCGADWGLIDCLNLVEVDHSVKRLASSRYWEFFFFINVASIVGNSRQ